MAEQADRAATPNERRGEGWTARVAGWLSQRRASSRDADSDAPPMARFRNVAISREAGAGGGAIARQVGTPAGLEGFRPRVA